MIKWNAGDRVKYLGSAVVPHGNLGTVQEDGTYPLVVWDNFKGGHDGAFAVPQRDLERVVGPSTYLNGHADAIDTSGKSGALGLSPSNEETTMPDDNRPRFMTAWMADTDEVFHPTGDAFHSLEDADNFAQTVLAFDGREGQIAVFEIRSVHLARLQITREAA